VRQAWR